MRGGTEDGLGEGIAIGRLIFGQAVRQIQAAPMNSEDKYVCLTIQGICDCETKMQINTTITATDNSPSSSGRGQRESHANEIVMRFAESFNDFEIVHCGFDLAGRMPAPLYLPNSNQHNSMARDGSSK